MAKSRQFVMALLGILAAACASQSPNQNINTGMQPLPVKHIYVVIAADTLISDDPGYIASMGKFKNLLRDKIHEKYPGTEVIFRHPIPGISSGWEMMVDVQDFNYVSRRQRFSGDSAMGDARLRVHIQLTDVRTRKTFDDYILGTEPGYPADKPRMSVADITMGTVSVAAQVGNTHLGVTTGQLLNMVSSDIAKSLDRQALAVHHP